METPQVPSDSDKVSVAVLAERLRMYMLISTHTLDTISADIHDVSAGMSSLVRSHERLDSRLDNVEASVGQLSTEVRKSVPIAWFRSTWGLVTSILAFSGGVLGIILLLEKLKVIP